VTHPIIGLGDNDSGQLGYFRRKGDEKVRRFRRTERMAQIAFWIGFAVMALFILVSTEMEDVLRDPMVVLMGVMLLLIGVRQSYAESVADAELIKQYEFMYRIFSNAKRRIDATSNDDEKRRVLRILGDAALGEHAQWILMHREKSLEQGEIFRMSGG
jgi:archaellum biogenesis protein FlaJ (TadC family)